MYGKRIVTVGLVVMGITSLAACRHPPANLSPTLAEEQTARTDRQIRVIGEYIVTLTAGAEQSAIQENYGRYGIKRINAMGNGIFLLSVSVEPGPEAMATQSREDKRIKSIQANFIYTGNVAGGNKQEQ